MKQLIRSGWRVAAIIAAGLAAGLGLASSSPAAEVVPAAADAAVLTNCFERIQREATRLMNWTIALERSLASRPGSPSAEGGAASIEQARQRQVQQASELENVARQLDALRSGLDAEKNGEKDTLEKAIREWEARLAAARKEREELAAEEARLLASLDEQKNNTGVSAAIAVEKKPIVFAISRSLIAPLEEPYFEANRVFLRSGGIGVKISPARDGFSLVRAMGEGGVLQKALDKADHDQEFVAFLLAPDSIDTYHAAIKELRKRRFHHTWIPWDGSAFVLDPSKKSDGPTYVNP